eukprot:m.157324 g.157324  ORF g.157324 m.157324 type:complete len:1028 (+) comp31051_c0_seq1:83-3166(+)
MTSTRSRSSLPWSCSFMLATVILGVAAEQRLTVSLDFGWRVATAAFPTTSYSLVINGTLSNSAWPSKAGAASMAECEAAAIKDGTQAYSYCPRDCGNVGRWKPLGEPVCIIGSMGRLNPNVSPTWQTRSRPLSVGPAAVSPEAARDYDDVNWTVVDLPHDASITTPYTEDADAGEAFIPAVRTFYRKHLRIPSAMRGMAITLVVDGALASSSWWINGEQIIAYKTDGYLPTTIRIDNIPNLQLAYADEQGVGDDNVFAVWTDNSVSTGWWYEGSGLVRHARLIATPLTSLQPAFAIATQVEVVGAVYTRQTPADGLYAGSRITPKADVVADGQTNVAFVWTIVDAHGHVVGTSEVKGMALHKGEQTITGAPIVLNAAELWTVARPYLYTLVTTLVHGADTDTVNTTIGVRELLWSPRDGLRVNNQRVKMRGFCEHENFAGVGAAIPPRVDLFRLQQMRGVGGNAWRTSHNPPEPTLLDMTDRLGVVVLDENRVLATHDNCGADPVTGGATCREVPAYKSTTPASARYGNFSGIAAEAGKLALRDRNHASVVFYSLCNELGCTDGTLLANDTAKSCYDAIKAADGNRAVTGNQAWQGPNAVAPNTPIANLYDVMGMSHQQSTALNTWHAASPGKLVVMTECCSCEIQRGEDGDMLPFVNTSLPWKPGGTTVWKSNENSQCLTTQVSISDNVDWVGGTFVWTLHDYIGEPDNNKWPHVSSSFGAFDLAGFPKAPVWWYRSRWLANISTQDVGRPALTATTIETNMFVRLVESWQPNPSSKTNTRVIHVYTNAPAVRILVNGKHIVEGAAVFVSTFGVAVFEDIPFSVGNITAQALSDAEGTTVLGSHTKHSWGNATSVVLSLDAPSVHTGTGSAVYLDGEDVALIRATIVDAAGVTVHSSSLNVTFQVHSGPARIAGVGNGDPAWRGPPTSTVVPTYHGLARAVAKVTQKATGSQTERKLEAYVNIDSGKSATSSQIITVNQDNTKYFIVMAHVVGLPVASITVPVSVDVGDSPLNVATKSVGLADIGA